MAGQTKLSSQQIRDLQELMEMPDDIRARMIAFAAGMLAMGAKMQRHDKTVRPEDEARQSQTA